MRVMRVTGCEPLKTDQQEHQTTRRNDSNTPGVPGGTVADIYIYIYTSQCPCVPRTWARAQAQGPKALPKIQKPVRLARKFKYRYTSDPCISMHGAKQNREQSEGQQNEVSQRAVFLNSFFEQPLRMQF